MQSSTHPLCPWIDSRMTRSEFARRIGTSQGHLSLVLQRKKGISLQLAVRIERETDGEFSASRLLQEQTAEAAQ